MHVCAILTCCQCTADASRQLTKALLQHDFGITWDLPLGQLVPPLANRANYLHWLADLLALDAPRGVPDGTVRGGCTGLLLHETCNVSATIRFAFCHSCHCTAFRPADQLEFNC